GADVLTYGEMMTRYAKVRGLNRWLVPVPVLTPRLSSYWVHLVTPIPATIARPLIEGLRSEVVVRDRLARELFPNIRLLDYANSVRAALAKLEAGEVETAWSGALAASQGDIPPVILTTHEGMVMEHRQLLVEASPSAVFRSFTSLGGETGWLYMNWAWQLRGMLDRLVGGVGMRRGRRNPRDLRVGDPLDFWRVEAIEPNQLMRLRAEMKVPGRAWLQFQARLQPDGRTLLSQTAFFAPKGLFGWMYWYVLYPIHGFIFSGMISRVAERAKLDGRPSSVLAS
ncbi:MAG: SDR family oxidoreductase, partial [Chloroflexales bacterium]|nr:SDR family oxidoreductase [Chloroflexales bacterium]